MRYTNIEITSLNTPSIVLHSVHLSKSRKLSIAPPSPPPHRRSLTIAKGQGSQNPKSLKEKYEPELKFLDGQKGRGRGKFKTKSPWGVQIFPGATYHIFTKAHLTCSSFLGSQFSIKFSLQLSLPLFFHFLLFLLSFPFLYFLSFFNLFILLPCLWKTHHKHSGRAKGLRIKCTAPYNLKYS